MICPATGKNLSEEDEPKYCKYRSTTCGQCELIGKFDTIAFREMGPPWCHNKPMVYDPDYDGYRCEVCDAYVDGDIVEDWRRTMKGEPSAETPVEACEHITTHKGFCCKCGVKMVDIIDEEIKVLEGHESAYRRNVEGILEAAAEAETTVEGVLIHADVQMRSGIVFTEEALEGFIDKPLTKDHKKVGVIKKAELIHGGDEGQFMRLHAVIQDEDLKDELMRGYVDKHLLSGGSGPYITDEMLERFTLTDEQKKYYQDARQFYDEQQRYTGIAPPDMETIDASQISSTESMEPPTKTRDPGGVPACHTCGYQKNWDKDIEQFVCPYCGPGDTAEAAKKTSQQAADELVAGVEKRWPEPPICCGQPMRYVSKYERWDCENCDKLISAEMGGKPKGED